MIGPQTRIDANTRLEVIEGVAGTLDEYCVSPNSGRTSDKPAAQKEWFWHALARDDRRNLLILFATCALILLIIPPQHDYPVLDDWIYSGSVRTMSETGAFVMPGMTQANLIGLALWGTLWVKVFGFSITVLTYSTLFLAGVALFSFYGIARAVEVPPLGALLGTLLLALNPFFLHLSMTFMTDVPFLALTLAACYCFIRGVKKGGAGWLLTSGALAGWSFLIRQFGILTVGCFVLYFVIASLQTKKWQWRDLAATLALPLLLVMGWYAFRAWQGIEETGMQAQHTRVTSQWIWKPEWLRVIGLWSLQMLPVAGFFAWSAVRLRWKRLWLVPLWLAIVIGGMYALDRPGEKWITQTDEPYIVKLFPDWFTLPYQVYPFGATGNILREGGIDFFQYTQEPLWSTEWWRVLWAVGVLLGVLLLAKMSDGLIEGVRALWRRERAEPLWALYGLGLAIFSTTVGFAWYYDRHILSFIPFVLLFVIRGAIQWGRLAWAYSWAAFAVLAIFSLLLKADHVSHNNARWEAARWLQARSPGVHGGFDWDNWVPANKEARENYQITDLPTPGFRTEREFPYTSMLSGGVTRFVLAEVREGLPDLP